MSTSVGRLALAAVSVAAASAAVLVSAGGEAPAQSIAAVSASPSPAQAQPSPSPSPTSGGTDFSACLDGDCEVQARQDDRISIDPGLGVSEIAIAGVGADAVRLAFTGTTTDVDGWNTTIRRRCYNVRCQVRGETTLSTGMPGRIGDVAIRVARVQGGTVVLVLQPAAQANT
ncbi:MAG: hypothetical protein IRZ07_06635 [Microbispora sp.]|nr:hypothetical protein [Microbispora sp.]